MNSLNRVVRNATVAASRPFEAPHQPLIDPDLRAAIDAAADEAYRRGLAEGRAQGRRDVEQAARTLAGALTSAVVELRRFHQEEAETALDVGLAVAEFVLERAPHDDGAVLSRRVAEALSELDDEEIHVAVHPVDHAAVAAVLPRLEGVVIETDPSLHPGEARIRGAWGSAELTRRAALEAAREVLQ